MQVTYSSGSRECEGSQIYPQHDVKTIEAELRPAQGSSSSRKKKSRFNSPGQGRKITYSGDTDKAIASHIKEKLENSDKVTVQYICSFAKQVICRENPSFVASSGWAHRFLARHGIVLQNIPKYKIRSVKSGRIIDYKGRPLSYSPETDLQIAEYVREQQSAGVTVTNSSLRNYARSVVQKENPNFTASASWAQNFLLRHRLTLAVPPSSLSDKPNTVTTSQGIPQQLKGTVSGQMQGHVSVNTAIPQASLTEDPITSYSILHSFRDVAVNHSSNSKEESKRTVTPSGQESEDMVTGSMTSETLMLSTDERQLNAPNQLLPTDAFVHSEGSLESSTVFSSAQSGPSFQTWSSSSTTPLPTLSLEGDDKSSPARCRPLSYPRETDQAVAEWVRKQQEAGERVTFSKLRNYAKKLIQPENPSFNASVGWVTPFLLRHNLDLSVNKKKSSLSLGNSAKRGSSNGTGQASTPNTRYDVPSQKVASKLRHTLDEKYEVVKVIKECGFSLQQSSRILGIAVSTLSGWVKMASSKQEPSEPQPTMPFDKKHEDTIVQWASSQIQQGQFLATDHVMAYAQSICSLEDPLFDAGYQWIQDVFDRHGIQLQGNSATPKGVSSDDGAGQQSESCLSPALEEYITTWIRQKVIESGKLGIVQVTGFIQSLLQESAAGFSVSLGWLFRLLVKHNLQLDPKPTTPDNIPVEFTNVQSKQGLPDTCVSSELSFTDNFQVLKSHEKPEGTTAQTTESAFTANKPVNSSIASDVLLSLSSVSQATSLGSGSPQSFLNKSAREFSKVEKEEVVKYANSTTLQKAAVKYGIAAPTVWRWRIELKMNSPRFSPEQKKCILTYTEQNGVKNASRKFGISTRTIQNWRKLFSPEVALCRTADQDFPYHSSLDPEEDISRDRPELTDVCCNQPFDFIMLNDSNSLTPSTQTTSTSLSQASNSNRTGKPMEVVMMPEECDVEYDIGSAEDSQGCYLVRWRLEEKLEILKYAHIHTPKLASERFGVNMCTLQQWMKAFGVPTISPADISVYLSASFNPPVEHTDDSCQGEHIYFD